MPNNRKTQEQKTFETFFTGEWILVDEVYQKAIQLVPPGKALRRFESVSQRKKDSDGTRGYTSEDDKIYSGARNIIRDWFHSPTLRPGLEFRTDQDEKKWVRRFVYHGQEDRKTDPFLLPFSRFRVTFPLRVQSYRNELTRVL